MKQFDNEISNKIQELRIEVQSIIGEKDKIKSEINTQTELLTKAEKDRDNTFSKGDTVGFNAAMSRVASANKTKDEAEVKLQNHNTKAKVSAILESVWPINKSITPMRQEEERQIEIHRSNSTDLEGLKGQVLAFAGELNTLISQL